MLQLVLIILGGVALYVVATAVFERFSPRRLVRAYQKFFGNPLNRPFAGVVPGWAVIETIGRRTGVPHPVPVGGRLRGDSFWLVAGDGRQAQYVRNLEANPRVRVRIHGRWRTGIAHVRDDDNPRRRLLRLNPVNSFFVWVAGTDLLSIRIDFDPR